MCVLIARLAVVFWGETTVDVGINDLWDKVRQRTCLVSGCTYNVIVPPSCPRRIRVWIPCITYI